MKQKDYQQEIEDLVLALILVRRTQGRLRPDEQAGTYILQRVISKLAARQLALADELLSRD